MNQKQIQTGRLKKLIFVTQLKWAGPKFPTLLYSELESGSEPYGWIDLIMLEWGCEGL